MPIARMKGPECPGEVFAAPSRFDMLVLRNVILIIAIDEFKTVDRPIQEKRADEQQNTKRCGKKSLMALGVHCLHSRVGDGTTLSTQRVTQNTVCENKKGVLADAFWKKLQARLRRAFAHLEAYKAANGDFVT